jgi:hypothetical protein
VAIVAAEEARMSHHERMEARYLLWQATGDAAHLEAAGELLDELRERAPAQYREAMMRAVPLHRAILEARRAFGDGATQVSTRG